MAHRRVYLLIRKKVEKLPQLMMEAPKLVSLGLAVLELAPTIRTWTSSSMPSQQRKTYTRRCVGLCRVLIINE